MENVANTVMFKYLNGLLASRPKKPQIAEDLECSFLSAELASDALGNIAENAPKTGVSLSSGPVGRLSGASRDRKVSMRHRKSILAGWIGSVANFRRNEILSDRNRRANRAAVTKGRPLE